MRYGLLGVLACLLIATTASAQTESGQVALSVVGGMDMPTGEAQDVFGNGYALGGGIAVGLGQSLSVEGDVVFHGDSVTETADVNGSQVTATAKSRALQMTAGLRYVVRPARNSVYLRGGAGAYRLSGAIEMDGESLLSGSETHPGATAGVGFQIVGRNGPSTFLEAGYHQVFADESDAVFSALIGVRFPVN